MFKIFDTFENCNCGILHFCDIEHIIIEQGANKKVSSIVSAAGCKDVVVVSDNNTHPLCAEDITVSIKEQGIVVSEMIYVRNGVLVPDEKSIIQLLEKVSSQTDMIIGVGSGVINDICKYVSFKLKIPYIIVATAPSMDGFASNGAAMIIDKMKITYNAHVPKAIIGDTDILKKAPIELIKSGLGDMLGKLSCLNDWKISHIVTGEVLCKNIYAMTERAVQQCLGYNEIDKILNRDTISIQRLMEGLVVVGVAMSYMNNSRPASGSEHHLSHFYEVINIMNEGKYFLHGIDVAYSTAVTNALRHKLVNEVTDHFTYYFNEDEWQADIKRIYGNCAEGVITLQKKLELYFNKNLEHIRKNWSQIREVLSESLTYEQTVDLLKHIGLDINEFYDIYGLDMIKNSIAYAKDLKDRYTLFWLLQDIGLLNRYSDEFVLTRKKIKNT